MSKKLCWLVTETLFLERREKREERREKSEERREKKEERGEKREERREKREERVSNGTRMKPRGAGGCIILTHTRYLVRQLPKMVFAWNFVPCFVCGAQSVALLRKESNEYTTSIICKKWRRVKAVLLHSSSEFSPPSTTTMNVMLLATAILLLLPSALGFQGGDPSK